MNQEIEALSYERALEELEQLIRRLEAGQVELEEAIACYERGVQLAAHCARLLDRTEAKVTQLVVGGGRQREEPFGDGEPAPGGAPAAPAAGARQQPAEALLPRARAAPAAFPGMDPAPARAAPGTLPLADDDIPF